MRLFTTEKETEVKINPTPSAPTPISEGRLVEKDDLLVQIDAFRQKAEALQNLINERQDRVLELEDVVREKESKNLNLQAELSKKQEILNGVLEDLKAQFDILANRIDTSYANANDELTKNISQSLKDEISVISGRLDESFDKMGSTVKTTVTEAKEPVIEKIHTENVRLYRNIYDFIKEDYDAEKLEAAIKKSGKTGRVPLIITLFLTIFNFIMLVVMMLMNFHII